MQKRLRRRDFLRILKTAKQVKSQTMCVFFKKNTLSLPRLGVTVTKKVSRRAVDRNRLKRVLRGIFDKLRIQLDAYDIVVKIKGAYTQDFERRLKQEWAGFLSEISR